MELRIGIVPKYMVEKTIKLASKAKMPDFIGAMS